MTQPARRQQGAILVLVLWFVVALSLLVLAGTRSTRQVAQDASLEFERMRSEALLDAALQLVERRLLDDKALASEYRSLRLGMGADTVDVEAVPSEGLVDVNVASNAVLRALFMRAGGLAQGEADILIDRIHDYIDPDDIPNGPGGAEAPQYRAAGLPDVPRNAGLDDLTELNGVMGMTTGLYAKIAPFLGLNGQQRIEAQAAPPALIDRLSAQQGLGAAVHAAPPEMRAALIQSDSIAELFSVSAGGAGGLARLTARLRSPDGRLWQRQVWVNLRTKPDSLTPWSTQVVEPTRRLPLASESVTP